MAETDRRGLNGRRNGKITFSIFASRIPIGMKGAMIGYQQVYFRS